MELRRLLSRDRAHDFLASRNYSISPKLSNVLDILRSVAAFMVVIWHTSSELFTPAADPNLLTQIFLGSTHVGAIAVVIFFVLSGFLVGRAAIQTFALHQQDGPKYALDRATRIYVVLIPALVIGFVLDYLLTHVFAPGHYGDVASALGIKTFLGNVFALQTLFTTVFGSNQPLWSLAFELWYYLMLPLALIAVFSKKPTSQIAALVVLAVSAAICVNHLEITQTPHLFKYLPYWLFGVLAWLPSRRLVPAWLCWIALFGFLATAHSPMLKVSGLGSVHFLGTAMTVALLLVANRFSVAKVSDTSQKVWAFFSGYSYSVYLFHYPLLILTVYFLRANGLAGFREFGFKAFAMWMAMNVLLYVYCYVCFFLTERNYHTLRRYLQQRLLPGSRRPSLDGQAAKPAPLN